MGDTNTEIQHRNSVNTVWPVCNDKKVIKLIMIQPRIAQLQNFLVLVRATQSGKSVQVFLCEINFAKKTVTSYWMITIEIRNLNSWFIQKTCQPVWQLSQDKAPRKKVCCWSNDITNTSQVSISLDLICHHFTQIINKKQVWLHHPHRTFEWHT